MKGVHSIEYQMKLQIKWFGRGQLKSFIFLDFKLVNTFFILMVHIFYLLSVSISSICSLLSFYRILVSKKKKTWFQFYSSTSASLFHFYLSGPNSRGRTGHVTTFGPYWRGAYDLRHAVSYMHMHCHARVEAHILSSP